MSTLESLGDLQEVVGDRYRLVRELGRGGMAIVFLADDLRQGRTVALKVLRPEVAAALGGERFLREIRIASHLQHPHILGLYDSGQSDGVLYYTMPYVEGESLRDRLARERQLPIHEAVRIAHEVAEALGHAHRHNVVHRDIKPGNILLLGSQAMVADFGLARAITESAGAELTKSGIAVGTPAYMSPEQAAGDSHLDGRSDIYALACVAYEMLAGEPPFTARTSQAVLAKHLQEPPPSVRVVRPTVPQPLQAALNRALAKIPADRFPTAEEFAAALEEGGRAPALQEAVATPLPLPAEPRRRRTRWVLAACAAALVGYGAWRVTASKDEELDPGRIVVFPLRDGGVPGAGEGVATYVGYALEGAAPLRWLEGWDWLQEPQRNGSKPMTADLAASISRAQRARYYIDGLIVRDPDSVTVVLRLHDVLGDSVVRQAGATGSQPNPAVPRLGLQAVAELLPALLEPGRRVDLTPLAQRRPAAIAAFLQGEHAYRRMNFTTALEQYRRAVREDSALAIAALKGSQAAHWKELNDEALRLVQVARASEHGLPPRYARLAGGLENHLLGHADSALVYFQRALALAPSWSEAWAAMAETYYHLLPSVSAPDSLAEAAFLRAVREDTAFTPPLLHLTEIALRRGDVESATALIRRFRRVGEPDSSLVTRLDLMLRCVRDGPAEASWSQVAHRDPDLILIASRLLSVGAAQPICAEAGFAAVLANERAPSNERWGALLGLQGLLTAQGRLAKVRGLLDSEGAAQVGGPVLYLIVAAAGAGLDDRAAEVADGFGTDYASMSTPILWALGTWAAHRADTVALGAISAALTRKADSTGARADSLMARVVAAHAILARGDSAAALDSIQALTPDAPLADIEWQPWESLGGERLLLARLLLSRGDYAGADGVASRLWSPQPVVYLTFLPAALEVRIQAAQSRGDQSQGERLRRRLTALRRDTLQVSSSSSRSGGDP
jgi:serine/threonine-protein kinase